MGKQRLLVQVNIAAFEYGLPGVEERQKYRQALQNEIASAADYAEDYAIEALYLTGPAPLQYPNEALIEIIDNLKNIFTFLPAAEINLYALPGSVTYGDLRPLHAHGLNRIRFGMHTFVQSELDALNRTYAPRAMEVFMRMVQLKLVFFNYDVTLYYGLPGQTPDSLRFSIEQAIRFMATHITLLPYPSSATGDLSSYYAEGVKMITSMGLEQYTPLHFARKDYTSVWDRLTYSPQARLGMGYGAVSQVDGMVIQNVKDVNAFMAAGGDPEATILHAQPLTQTDIETGLLLNALFNLQACDVQPFADALKQKVNECRESGYLVGDDEVVQLTDAGKTHWRTVVGCIQA